MPFKLPTFNLTINIWRDYVAPNDYTIPDVVTVTNMSPGKRQVANRIVGFNPLITQHEMYFLVPKLTDVRAGWNGSNADVVECPAGSKRFYAIIVVDDIGKGFANEHRFCDGYYLASGVTFNVQGLFGAPVPMP
jgi:hypothetical protein